MDRRINRRNTHRNTDSGKQFRKGLRKRGPFFFLFCFGISIGLSLRAEDEISSAPRAAVVKDSVPAATSSSSLARIFRKDSAAVTALKEKHKLEMKDFRAGQKKVRAELFQRQNARLKAFEKEHRDSPDSERANIAAKKEALLLMIKQERSDLVREQDSSLRDKNQTHWDEIETLRNSTTP